MGHFFVCAGKKRGGGKKILRRIENLTCLLGTSEYLQNSRFSKSPILKIFFRKFSELVLGLVGLIDVKGIDVAQPFWC